MANMTNNIVKENAQMTMFDMTKENFDSLQAQFDELLRVKRPEIVARIAEARGHGDLSENAEYVAGQEELKLCDIRLHELEEQLKNANIIEVVKTRDVVGIGSVVTCVESDTGATVRYQITTTFGCDALSNKISHLSPAGSALLGRRVGDTVRVFCPVNFPNYDLTIRRIA